MKDPAEAVQNVPENGEFLSLNCNRKILPYQRLRLLVMLELDPNKDRTFSLLILLCVEVIFW